MEDQPPENKTDELPTPVTQFPDLQNGVGEADQPKTDPNSDEGQDITPVVEATKGEPSTKPVSGKQSVTVAKSTSGREVDKKNNVSPTSSGEDLQEEEIHNIIKQTQDILHFCQTKVDDQKIIGHSLTFMLVRIKETMDSYCKDYIPNLNTFLVNADTITGDYYARMCCNLPQSGDYVKAIENAEGDMLEAGGDQQVSKGRLLQLVTDVTNNLYASAMFVKSIRAVQRDVNNTLVTDRRDMLGKIYTPFPDWMGIQNNVNFQLESIRDQTFKISTYIDFLKHGESKKGPKLDLSHLEKKNLKKNDQANIL